MVPWLRNLIQSGRGFKEKLSIKIEKYIASELDETQSVISRRAKIDSENVFKALGIRGGSTQSPV